MPAPTDMLDDHVHAHVEDDAAAEGSTSMHCFGLDGIITWASREELHSLGYPSDEFIGHHIAKFHVDAQVIVEMLGRLTKLESLKGYPARLRHKHGYTIYVEIDSSVCCNADGQSVQVRCVTRNVTAARLQEMAKNALDVKAKEQELRRQSSIMERAMQSLHYENRASMALLQQLLPPKVAADLTAGRPVPPEAYDHVTVGFSDIEGFTQIAAAVQPLVVMQMLHKLYSVMDYCVSLFPLYKVETIGDSYMVVGGLPEARSGHTSAVADFAVLALNAVPVVVNPAKPDSAIRLRMGLHSGPVVGGIVGQLMPRYHLFGDTVNTASRMESTSEAGRIQCSATVAASLLAGGEHFLEERGSVLVKGKGAMTTYWLNAGTECNNRCNGAAIKSALATAQGLVNIPNCFFPATHFAQDAAESSTHTMMSMLTGAIVEDSIEENFAKPYRNAKVDDPKGVC